MVKLVDHAEIIRLHHAGLSARRIAEQVGCTSRTVTRVRARYGLSQPVPPNSCRPVSADRLERASRMLADGMSLDAVSAALGMHDVTLRRHFPEARRWTPQEAGAYGRMVRRVDEVA